MTPTSRNFGVFASPERELVFDINDFDETLPGPWEWDVKRLAASLAIAGRDNGFSAKERARGRPARGGAGTGAAMREFAAMRNLDVWYAHIERRGGAAAHVGRQLDTKSLKEAERIVAKARTKDSMQAFAKLTHVVDGERRIISDPPLIVPIEELLAGARSDASSTRRSTALIRSYRRTLQRDRRHLLEEFRFVAHRPQGGRRRQRRHPRLDRAHARPRRPRPAVPAGQGGPGVGPGAVRRQEPVRNHGQRVVAGQRLMQAASDIFLGWERVEGSTA